MGGGAGGVVEVTVTVVVPGGFSCSYLGFFFCYLSNAGKGNEGGGVKKMGMGKKKNEKREKEKKGRKETEKKRGKRKNK